MVFSLNLATIKIGKDKTESKGYSASSLHEKKKKSLCLSTLFKLPNTGRIGTALHPLPSHRLTKHAEREGLSNFFYLFIDRESVHAHTKHTFKKKKKSKTSTGLYK